MSQLIFVEQKPMQGKEHVPQSGAVIGREGVDINLADPEVSRRHATIHVDGEKVSIEDLGSTNGTFVNGQQIQGTRELSEGDEVRLGNTVWRVQPSAQATAVADAPAAAPPQVTAARQVPEAAPPPPGQAPPAPAPPTPAAAPPTAQQPAAPKPPAPQPPAAGGGAGGARGDVPAPDVQPSGIRRVVPPPGGPAPFQELAPKRQRGSAATRFGATLMATIAVALTAVGVVAYYLIEPFEASGSEDVEAVIVTYAEALADGDGDTACEQLTEDAQDDLVSDAEGVDGGCEEIVEMAGDQLTDEQKDDFRDIEPRDVEVDGDTATAVIENSEGEESTVELAREGGDWKISNPGN